MNDRLHITDPEATPEPTAGAGSALFQAGVTALNAIKFRHMNDPINGPRDAQLCDYFDFEIDALDFYAQSVRDLYPRCPRCVSFEFQRDEVYSGGVAVATRRHRIGVLAPYAPTGLSRCVYCGRHYAIDRTGLAGPTEVRPL